MPASIKNIKITSEVFEKRPNVSKWFNLINKHVTDVDYKVYIPQTNWQTLRCEIYNSCPQFVNAIRKTVMSELSVWSLTLDLYNIKIDYNDDRILIDVLKQKIESIAINQNIDSEKIKKWEISLEVANNTDKMMYIMSNHISIFDQISKKDISTKLIPQTIPLVPLQPTKHLKLNSIVISRGFGYSDMNAFPMVHSVFYKTLDGIPLQVLPTKFGFGFTTYGNIEPKQIMQMACNEIKNKLVTIKQYLPKEQETSNIIESITEFMANMVEIRIKNQRNIVTPLIAYYCSLMDPTIDYVAHNIVRPTKDVDILHIKHKDYKKIIDLAIDKIIGELEIFAKNFK